MDNRKSKYGTRNASHFHLYLRMHSLPVGELVSGHWYYWSWRPSQRRNLEFLILRGAHANPLECISHRRKNMDPFTDLFCSGPLGYG